MEWDFFLPFVFSCFLARDGFTECEDKCRTNSIGDTASISALVIDEVAIVCAA